MQGEISRGIRGTALATGGAKTQKFIIGFSFKRIRKCTLKVEIICAEALHVKI